MDSLDPHDDPISICQEYLQYRGVTGTVIFAMMTGSQAYNLANAESDKDYLGIYMVDTKQMLSIDGELSFPNQPVSTLPTEVDRVDTALYEVKQFLKLAIKGNPFMIEMLFASRNYVSTPCFDRLRALRKAVLSQTLVEEFLSYIRGQIIVHQRKGLKGKRLYHIIRLLFELNRIIKGEDPLIAFPEGSEKECLLAIRRMEKPGPEIVEMAEGMMRDIEAQRPWNLPKECAESFEQWLVAERLRVFEFPGTEAT